MTLRRDNNLKMICCIIFNLLQDNKNFSARFRVFKLEEKTEGRKFCKSERDCSLQSQGRLNLFTSKCKIIKTLNVKSINYHDLIRHVNLTVLKSVHLSVLHCKSISSWQKLYFAHETAICRNQWNTVMQETKKSWRLLSRPTLRHVMFLLKNRKKQYFFMDTALWRKVRLSNILNCGEWNHNSSVVQPLV